MDPSSNGCNGSSVMDPSINNKYKMMEIPKFSPVAPISSVDDQSAA